VATLDMRDERAISAIEKAGASANSHGLRRFVAGSCAREGLIDVSDKARDPYSSVDRCWFCHDMRIRMEVRRLLS